MRVKYAIQQLSDLDPEDEIVIAYWTKEWFIDVLGREINDDQWDDISGAGDDVIDNMPIGDYLEAAATEILDNEETAQ
jgi:hypothetical protein